MHRSSPDDPRDPGTGSPLDQNSILVLTGGYGESALSQITALKQVDVPSAENGWYSKAELRREARKSLYAEMVEPALDPPCALDPLRDKALPYDPRSSRADALCRLGAVDCRLCSKDGTASKQEFSIDPDLHLDTCGGLNLIAMIQFAEAAEKRLQSEIGEIYERRSIRIHRFGGLEPGAPVGLWWDHRKDMPGHSHLVSLRVWIKAAATGAVMAFAECTLRVP